MRGYYGIGIFNPKKDVNVGGLLRAAHCFNASHIFIIGKKYKGQSSDTTKASKHIPFYQYLSFDQFFENKPIGSLLIGVEIVEGATPIQRFVHPERAIYLLGAEDNGLPENVLQKCNAIVSIPTKFCLNVSVTGAIIMYDRMVLK